MIKNITKFIIRTPALIAVLSIEVYQRLLSPDHSWLKHRYPYGYCRHFPSCSQYSKEAIVKHGLIKGGWLALKRVGRCNPWTESKVDLVG